MGELQSAVQSFERSLELAKVLDDEASQEAIKKALDEVNTKIVGEIKQENNNDESEVDPVTKQENENTEGEVAPVAN